MSEPVEPEASVPRKALIVYWDPVANEVDYDGEGLSVFDIAGMLASALEVAAGYLPSASYAAASDDES